MRRLPFLFPILVLMLATACQTSGGAATEVSPTFTEATVNWTWTSLTDNNPSSRGGMQAVYDSTRQVIVLFGGRRNTSQLFSETWEFDGANWHQVQTLQSPPARFWHGMAYDSTRRVVVMFGGDGSAAQSYYNDTWEYDGINWTRATTTHSPAPRGHGAMLVYDSCRQRTVLFGGETSSGTADSTWEYDGSDWTQMQVSISPPGRWLSAMVFDPQRCRTVLFGGGGDLAGYDDTWEYDGDGWMRVQTASSPSARWAHAMAYDPTTATILLFGGYVPGLSASENDTWRYDGTNWEKVFTITSATPSEQHILAWDGGNNRILMLGYDSTWILEPFSGVLPAGAAKTPTVFGANNTRTADQPAASTTPTRTRTPTVQRTPGCDAGFSQLQAGMTAILTEGTVPNRVRSEPRLADNIISLLYTGTTVKILGGPVCVDGLVFWQVESATIPGGSGWTAEGDGTAYYLEPHTP